MMASVIVGLGILEPLHAPSVLVRKATLARDKYELVITPPYLDE
jgi:hypothetical protein